MPVNGTLPQAMKNLATLHYVHSSEPGGYSLPANKGRFNPDSNQRFF